MKRITLYLLLVINLLNSQIFYGKIVSKETGESIVRAMIFQGNNGTYSDDFGRFQLKLNSLSDSIYISHISYKIYSIHPEVLKEESQIIYLESILFSDTVEIVTAQLPYFPFESSQPGISLINTSKMKEFPTLGGEQDILRMLQMKNGVMIGKDLSNAFYVRGGRSDHNLILLDGMELFNPSHLLGFFSVFNTQAVKSIELYKSSIPFKYSGRLASVTNVVLKEGNTEKLKYGAGWSLISLNAYIEGPISKQLSFYFTARRAYYDILLALVKQKMANEEDKQSDNDDISFSDYILKMSFQLSKNDQFLYNGSFGKDYLYIAAFSKSKALPYEVQHQWQNNAHQFRWLSTWSPTIQSTSGVRYSVYKSIYKDAVTMPLVSKEVHLNKLTFFQEWDLLLNEDHSFKMGYDFSRMNFSANLYYDIENSEYRQRVNETHLYFGSESRWLLYLTSHMGFNINFYNSDFILIDPRIALKYKLNETSQFKFSYDKEHQTLHTLSSAQLHDGVPLFYPSTKQINSEWSKSYSLAFENSMSHYQFQLESYFRKFGNIPMLSKRQTGLNESQLNEILDFGEGDSYGFDIVLEKPDGLISGWLNYNYNISEYQFEKINSGEKFFPKFHKTHQINLVMNYQLKESWKLGLLAQLSSGMLYTRPTHYSWAAGTKVYYFNKLNNAKTDANWRIDINFRNTYKWWNADWELMISIYNLFASPNPITSYYKGDDILLINMGFLPSIGLKVDFNQ